MEVTNVDKQVLKALSELPQVECPVEHLFGGGCYVRHTTMPAGTFAVGKRHKNEVINILLKGKISVLVDDSDEVKEIAAPAVFLSSAGTRKAAYFHEDTVWLNVHPTELTSVEEVEQAVIVSDNNDVDLLGARLQSKLQKLIGG